MVSSMLQNSSMRNLTELFVVMGIESVNLTSAYASKLLKKR